MTRPGDSPQLSRRQLLQAGAISCLGAATLGGVRPQRARGSITPGTLPAEPMEIGREPQFVFDLHTVDCTWSLREKQEPIRRVFHACKKHGDRPLLTGDQPSHFWVVRDADTGLFRLWYQLNHEVEYPQGRQKGQNVFETYMAYAESRDGLTWERPALDLFKGLTEQKLPNNCVLFRPKAPRNAFDTPQIVEVPEADRRGYRYLMLYLGAGADSPRRMIRLVGSQDGIHWDLEHDQLISPIGSDHANCIIYNSDRKEYDLFLRAKQIYLAPGQGKNPLDAGQSRRGVARMTSPELWTEWRSQPQTIMTPDEVDADAGYNYFYGMPVRRHAGIYWGFLQSFRLNDYMHAELTWSRNGIDFERLPARPKLIEYGPKGSWDDTMILACPNWIEVGNEWWIYYNGWDGPHETPKRTGGIGLAKIRKEGFISQHGPAGGGVVCTRSLRWPGGDLLVNADARAGELKVRVSDEFRKPIAGFNYDDGPTFTGDSVAQSIQWKTGSLDSLKGRNIRLEFSLKNADLYTFRAAEPK